MATNRIPFEANFTKAVDLDPPFDMNDITTAGLYRARTVAGIDNWPAVDGFQFFAVIVSSASTMMQIVFGGRVAGSAGSRTYVRYLTNSTWGPWIYYQGIAV